MGLEEVEREILEKANREAEKILGQAKAEAEAIGRNARKKADELKAQLESRASAEIEALERKESAKASFEVKKQMLARKQELVERVFREAGKELAQLKPEQNRKHFELLLGKAEKHMKISRLRINRKDSTLAGNYAWIDSPMIGGLMAENQDSSIVLDYSYDAMLKQARIKVLSKVAGILFE